VTPEQYAADMSVVDAVCESVKSRSVEIVDCAPAICATGGGLLTNETYPIYYDSHHLLWHGAMTIVRTIEPIFEFIVKAEAEPAANST
jgi:hypothetical protein